jgi:hypothetical protein
LPDAIRKSLGGLVNVPGVIETNHAAGASVPSAWEDEASKA